MRTLPRPTGPYAVGSVIREFVDRSRPAHLATPDVGRRILVKAWYPADESDTRVRRREGLWEQLRQEPNFTSFAKLLLRRAMKVMTNTYEGARYAAQAGPPRILIYNHGLVSFASENSMLMEHLASHGYFVIALQHRDQLTELRTLEKALPETEKQEQAKLRRQIKACSGEERAALWKEYFRIASNTNRIVSERAVDIEYVVAELDTPLTDIPDLDWLSPPVRLDAAGLSVGGAVATEYARRNDGTVRSVVNLDGGIYGEHLETPIESRYLMLYSEENFGAYDLALIAGLGAELVRHALPGTKHLNFHDVAALYPVLRWFGAIGSANPVEVTEELVIWLQHKQAVITLDCFSIGFH